MAAEPNAEEAPRLETLEEVFSNAEPEKEEAAGEPEPEQEAPVEAEADEPEAAKADEGEAEESTPEPEEEKPDWKLSAVLDEREKRQKAVAEAEKLRKELDGLKKQDVEMPDIFEDQEGAINALKQGFAQDLMRERFNMSQEFMRMTHDDYDAREAEFLEMANDSPELLARLKTHPNPARFAYETAEKHAKLTEMENIEEWREKERARIRQELEAEMQQSADDAATETEETRKSLTPSLAETRSPGGAQKGTQEQSLEEILGG